MMTPPIEGTLCYYVSTMRVRRELIPVNEGDRLIAYRCLTYAVDGPNDGDKIVADQTEFEDELIRLRLMQPRDTLQLIFAGIWRGLNLDPLFKHRPTGSEPTETLLRIIA
jgi:hypothetical protein